MSRGHGQCSIHGLGPHRRGYQPCLSRGCGSCVTLNKLIDLSESGIICYRVTAGGDQARHRLAASHSASQRRCCQGMVRVLLGMGNVLSFKVPFFPFIHTLSMIMEFFKLIQIQDGWNGVGGGGA